MGSVNITLTSGALGSTLQTNDGVAGLIATGTSQGAMTVGTPFLISSVEALEGMGVDGTTNAFLYKQVREFYDEAGKGAELYVMAASGTVQLDHLVSINEDWAPALLRYANGRIKLLGVVTADEALGEDLEIAGGLNSKVGPAIDAVAELFDEWSGNRHQPFRTIIGGTSFSGVAGDLSGLLDGTVNNMVSVLIGDTVSGAGACVGLALGRLATVPVQRKLSRVRTGPLNITNAYIADSHAESSMDDINVIAGNGYITFATYPNVAGYFFSSDSTASATTDDYHFLCRGRVIDKAHILAYTTFVQEVDDEVPVNTDGTLDAGFCKWLSQQIVNQINNTMTINKEISSVSCTIDPAQNILSTNRLNVALRIIPVGYATDIEISLGFENPAL